MKSKLIKCLLIGYLMAVSSNASAFDKNKLKIEKLAEQDDEKIDVFRTHALQHLRKFNKEKIYPNEKKIYWGW